MFISEINRLKSDLRMVMNGSMNHAVVTQTRAERLLNEIESMEAALKQIKDIAQAVVKEE